MNQKAKQNKDVQGSHFLLFFLIFFICVSIFIMGFPKSSNTTQVIDVSSSLSGYLDSLSDNTTKLHHRMAEIANSKSNKYSLFDRLDKLLLLMNQTASSEGFPSYNSIAVYEPDVGWIAWAGLFSSPAIEWLNQKDDSGRKMDTYLYESPTRSLLISCSNETGFILVSTLTVSVNSELKTDDLKSSSLLESVSAYLHLTTIYESPFTSIPEAVLLDKTLRGNPQYLRITDEAYITNDSQSQNISAQIFEKLFDPQFYTGDLPFLSTAGHLLVLGLFLWFVSSLLHIRILSGRTKFLIIPFSAAGVVFFWKFAHKLAVSLVENTNSAWWPSFHGEVGWTSIVLPFSALLLAGAVLRFVLWSIFLWFSLGSRLMKTYSSKPIPGWFVQTITIAVIAPVIIQSSETTIHNNLANGLSGWIHEKENTLNFALEANLEKLRHFNKLSSYNLENNMLQGFEAFKSWNHSDLDVLNINYGIEILDIDGFVTDRFSPSFRMLPIPTEMLNRLNETEKATLVLPRKIYHNRSDSPLIGIAKIDPQLKNAAYIVIQIPSGPESTKPGQGQWGEHVQYFFASGGSNPFWPEDCPVPYDAEWFDTAITSQTWIEDEARQFDIIYQPLPETDINQPEIVFAVLPRYPSTVHYAGIARLGLLAFLLLIPGLLYHEIKQRFFSGVDGYSGSFTNQLLAAFILPVIVLPLVFATTLHSIIKDTSAKQHVSQMTNLLDKTMIRLKDQILQFAIRKQANIEQQLLAYEAVVRDSSDESWLILNAQGYPVISSLIPLKSGLPLDSIAQVYQSSGQEKYTNWSISLEYSESGILVGQVVLPYPLSKELLKNRNISGTFVCEIPINGDLVQAISDPSDIAVDIYAQGKICASNRPECFNTDLIPTQLTGKTYQKLNTATNCLDRSQNSITGVINNNAGQRIAFLRITPHKIPTLTSGIQPEDWFFITTLLLLIAGFVLSNFFGRRLAGPIQALTQGAHDVAAGKMDIRVPVMGIGETKMLTRTFNSMIVDLGQKQRDLEERHLFISTLLAQMSSTIIAINSEGTILTVNKSFERLFELKSAEVTGKNVFKLLTELNLPQIRHGLISWLDKTGDEKLVTKLRREGRSIHLAAAFVALKSSNSRSGTLIVLDDVTSTIQSSKLQAYGDLARRIAHEVKNPLTPIQLSIEHLRQAWEDGADNFADIFNTCIDMVLTEVNSLEKIASEFSRFARFPKPQFQISDIGLLLEEVAQMYHGTPEGVLIQLNSSREPLMCRFDRDQIRRVLINLVQNALHAVGDHGLLQLTGKKESGWIVVSVSDNGIGMDEQTLIHLFEPYFSTKKEGTGLGLVITKAVIDAHDADIQVKSVPNKGTEFIIRFAAVNGGNDDKENNSGS